MHRNLYALILAGGSGERFWPLSRRTRPKQLLSLFSKETLLEGTLARLEGLVPPERILILTNTEQEAAVRALVPRLPAENIVAEPAKRDTAAAIALGAGWIARRDANAAFAVLPADQLIRDVPGFHRTLRAAADAAEETGALVTIGIRPTWACPSFGYIEQGAPLPRPAGGDAPAVYEVCRFREKPDAATAKTFLAAGNFRWNAGMFVWTLPAILSELRQHAPELADFAAELQGAASFKGVLAARFPSLPKISIDYAVMEKAARVLEVEAAFDWDDVGSWPAAAKYWQHDEAQNASPARLTAQGASGNIVFAQPGVRVALLGVENLIVVQTADALLVCHKDQAEKIKAIVGQLPPELQ